MGVPPHYLLVTAAVIATGILPFRIRPVTPPHRRNKSYILRIPGLVKVFFRLLAFNRKFLKFDEIH